MLRDESRAYVCSVAEKENHMSQSVTVLLKSHRDGDSQALNQLAELIYPELKALARNRSRNSSTGATTLVNETFVKLLSGGALTTEDKGLDRTDR